MRITKEENKRWRRIEIKVLKHTAQKVADAGAVEAFKDYLLERFCMDHKKEELPDSPIEICRMLAVDYGWGVSDTFLHLCEFTTRIGLTPEFADDDEEYGEPAVPTDNHNWQEQGF
jgi:hypothetical protein